MDEARRLGLVRIAAERGTVVETAEVEGCLFQNVLVRRLIGNAACERGMWPQDRQRCIAQHIREVRRG